MLKKITKQKKIVLSNFISLSFLQGANYILPLITLPYLVKVLGIDKFGLVMLAQSVSLFFLIAVNFGFDISGTREIAILKSQKKDISKTFWSIIIIKLALVITCSVILFIIVKSVNRFNENETIYFLSYGVVVGQSIFPDWYFMGIEKMKFVTITNVTAKVIFTILIFLFIKSEQDFYYVPIFNSFGFILAGVLGFSLALRQIKFVLPSKTLIKSLFVDSVSLFIGKFFTNFYTSTNLIILSFFTGDVLVGVYSSIEKLLTAIRSVYIPIYQSVFPWFSTQQGQKKINIFHKILLVVSVIGIVIFFGVLFTGDFVLDFMFGDPEINKYSYVFKTLGIISLLSGLSMAFISFYLPSEKLYNLRMKIFIIVGISNFILSVILVRLYLINGNLVRVLISEILLLALGFYYYKQHAKGKLS